MNIRRHLARTLIAAIVVFTCCASAVPAQANDSPNAIFDVVVNESSISVTASIPDELAESGLPYLWAMVDGEAWGPYGDGVNTVVSVDIPITPQCGATYDITVYAGNISSMVAELDTTTVALPDSACAPRRRRS
ncbi:hypothetical protein BLEM_1525 [Bifidobacterium lemurum]|uniref:Uncharacterized protein n=1 Tax=Bifidobacterium lemurum TaxID=1603886 RepID=A0A261FQS5_9BIFI|nr:hypothetical protein [Bifidobacterium lemurum]OZG61313.1 hypothetical protein BLEM_1525 [Bifidobacterium lemurum]QOL34701.1 hypothetical protein BL8807_01900 [Bifidobacterium lemurum]